jgi:hypothetical protein
MKIEFKEKDRNKVLALIQDAMGGRKLAELVKFNLKTDALEVVISKLGTSTLTFAESSAANGLTYKLTNEKIAFTHKAFKDEVTQKIMTVIEQAGGKIS